MPSHKLRLNRADAYQAKVAALYLCEMLASYALGNPHPRCYRSLGAEQGLPGWDDFVVELDGGARIYHQVKRQESSFCTRVEQRPTDTNGNLAPLSALDQVFADVGRVSGSFKQTDCLSLDLLSSQVRVKRSLQAKDLRDFALECAKPGVVAARLQDLTQEQRFRDLFTWLTTWCDFRDWDHIHAVFSKLKVSTLEDETQLKARAVSHLGASWSEPDVLFEDIVQFVQSETSYAGALDASILWRRFHGKYLSSQPRWTRYTQAQLTAPWFVNGIQDVTSGEVERATSVVSQSWDANCISHLYIGVDPPPQIARERLPLALSRLTLHLPQSSSAMALKPCEWRNLMVKAVGETLGLRNSHPPGEVPVRAATSMHALAGARCCDSVPEGEVEAEALQQAMDRGTWDRLLEAVELRLRTDVADDALRTDLRNSWTSWVNNMGDGAKRDLMMGLMRAESEGEQVQARLRVGPRTVGLMAEAVVLRLVVQAAAARGGTWDRLTGDLPVRTLALETWAGPAGSAAGAQRVDVASSCLLSGPVTLQTRRPIDLALPGDERCTVLVMSGVRSSATGWLQVSLAGDATSHHNLASDERRVVVTNDPELHRELQATGRMDQFGRRLRERLDTHTRTRDDASTALDDLVA